MTSNQTNKNIILVDHTIDGIPIINKITIVNQTVNLTQLQPKIGFNIEVRHQLLVANFTVRVTVVRDHTKCLSKIVQYLYGFFNVTAFYSAADNAKNNIFTQPQHMCKVKFVSIKFLYLCFHCVFPPFVTDRSRGERLSFLHN